MLRELREKVTTKINSNCLGYAAYALGLIDVEETLMPFDFDRLFGSLIKWRSFEAVKESPFGARAIVSSQSLDHGPFFPLHIAVLDSQDLTKITHRSNSGHPVTTEELYQFMDNELRLGRVLYFLS